LPPSWPTGGDLRCPALEAIPPHPSRPAPPTMEPIYAAWCANWVPASALTTGRPCGEMAAASTRRNYVGSLPADPRSFRRHERQQLGDPPAGQAQTLRLPDGRAEIPGQEASHYGQGHCRRRGLKPSPMLRLGAQWPRCFNENPPPASAAALPGTQREHPLSRTAPISRRDPMAGPSLAIHPGLAEILQAQAPSSWWSAWRQARILRRLPPGTRPIQPLPARLAPGPITGAEPLGCARLGLALVQTDPTERSPRTASSSSARTSPGWR